MNRRQRKEMADGPGTSVIVTDGDLSTALRLFKQKVKISGKLRDAKRNSEFIKPSSKRRQVIDRAKYRTKLGLDS